MPDAEGRRMRAREAYSRVAPRVNGIDKLVLDDKNCCQGRFFMRSRMHNAISYTHGSMPLKRRMGRAAGRGRNKEEWGMYHPTLEEAKQIAETEAYRVIPVSMEIYSDIGTPIEVLRRLKKVSRYCYILESVEQTRKWGRYTFLGYEPRLQITCLNGRMTVNGGMRQTQETVNPGAYIREILKQYKSPRLQKLPPFTGGLVGYFSYDYIKYSEPSLKLNAADSEGFSDVDLMLFDKVIAFDNLRQKIILIMCIRDRCRVARYHSLAADLATIPPDLKITAQTADGQVMAVEHVRYPVYGVQFHPESVMTECGLEMIRNLYGSSRG